LYVLVIEALVITNQTDPQIERFILPDRSVQKLVQNADTTVLVCSNTAILKLFNTFGRYEHTSGAKQNLSGNTVNPLRSTWIGELITSQCGGSYF
jgi:hypothetical protein